MSRLGLDFGEFDAFLHDIADLAFDFLHSASEGRTQGLLHLHHFECQDIRAVVSAIEVDDTAIRIIGSKDML